MGDEDEQDETPIDARTPAAIERRAARQRPLIATERVGRSSLIHDGDARAMRGRTATPPTGVTLPLSPDSQDDEEFPSDGTVAAVARDITNVEIMKQRLKARLRGTSRFEDQLGAIAEELMGTMRRGEARAADRAAEVLAARGGPDVGKRLDELESNHQELVGKDGKGGLIGALRGEQKLLRGVLVAIGLAVLGGATASAKALYTAGEASGAERAEFQRLQHTVDIQSERLEQLGAAVLRLQFGIPPAPAGSQGDIP